jgi:hypothetical protein
MERIMTSAADTYRARLAEVRDLIRRFEGSLAIHGRRQAARPADWGFPGDLAHIAEQLKVITPSHQDRRREWKHPKACGNYATICTPDGRLLCGEHAIESDSDPRDCLDVTDGSPVDED